MTNSILYSDNHLWVRQYDDNVRIGLSSYALKKMKAIIFLNLPEIGEIVSKGETFGDVESLKTVSDLISPVSGTVTEINEEIIDSPEPLFESDDCWMITVQVTEPINDLMNPDEYSSFIAGGDK